MRKLFRKGRAKTAKREVAHNQFVFGRKLKRTEKS
jgi:hypothetical protein